MRQARDDAGRIVRRRDGQSPDLRDEYPGGVVIGASMKHSLPRREAVTGRLPKFFDVCLQEGIYRNEPPHVAQRALSLGAEVGIPRLTSATPA
jgi:hypothetical protein